MFREKYFNLCRKVWSKFRISLPLWRLHYKEYAKELQAELDRQHSIRDVVDAVYGVSYTTLQAYLILEALKNGLPDMFPLITPENRSYIRK